MKLNHIKLFENFNKSCILDLVFTNDVEYEKAVQYFTDESMFFFENNNDEFRTLSFSCADENDMDITEVQISKDLNENGFENYYFES